MGRDDLESHWRKPGDGDMAAWIRELRVRSHDIANWASRMEGELLAVKQGIEQIGTADEIADKVEQRMTRKLTALIGWTPKVLGFAIAVMTTVTMFRTF